MKAGNVWLYQCNPKPRSKDAYFYTPEQLKKDCKKGRYLQTDWYCPQYFNDIRAGDVVILHFAGKDGGVFGMGRVTNVRAAGKVDSVISIRLDKRVTDHLMEHPIPGKAVYGLGMIKNQRQTLHDVTDKWHELAATLSVISSVFY